VHEIGVPVSFSGTPGLPVQKPAPRLGQHSAEVLREAGLSEEAVQTLLAMVPSDL
jgi:crotonobetainyl-CoA:carnitine CoA-transferase CaiB-like acyl-CoA transferase